MIDLCRNNGIESQIGISVARIAHDYRRTKERYVMPFLWERACAREIKPGRAFPHDDGTIG